MGQERRRYPRAKVDVGIMLDAGGSQWQGRMVNLSPYGAKVALAAETAHLSPGTSVELSLAIAAQDSPVRVSASVRRADPDGTALSFDGLEDGQFQQLKALVDSSLKQEWEDLVTQLGADREAVARGSFSKFLENRPAGARRVGGGSWGTGVRKPSADSEDESERERFQALLNRLGFNNLQLPSDGTLARQWRDFLKRLEAEE